MVALAFMPVSLARALGLHAHVVMPSMVSQVGTPTHADRRPNVPGASTRSRSASSRQAEKEHTGNSNLRLCGFC
jgi:hypothetical protein